MSNNKVYSYFYIDPKSWRKSTNFKLKDTNLKNYLVSEYVTITLCVDYKIVLIR